MNEMNERRFEPRDESMDVELSETTLSPLSVYCDFNDLCVRFGVDEAFVIVAKLKDLLA